MPARSFVTTLSHAALSDADGFALSFPKSSESNDNPPLFNFGLWQPEQ
jgi:hypothetical protein